MRRFTCALTLCTFALATSACGRNEADGPPPSDEDTLRGDDDDVDDGDDDAPADDDQPACTTVAARPGTVITTSGAVTGQKTDTTWSWKGVRYAEPPVGELRWKPPVPASCVATEVFASAFGPTCPQLSDGTVIGNEDCLTLNVWAREDAHDAPVLFFVHGGGNAQGTASDPLYDGHELATRTGAVVVTIAYRLGALGYFTHRGLDAESTHAVSGNYGILDQQAALRWVQANVAAFGGSPTHVLLFGESAGGQNTLVHIASPLSAGLFHAAIVESGGVYRTTIEDAQAAMQELVAAVDCDDAIDEVACMRGRTVDSIVGVPSAIGPLEGEGMRYGPVVDGYVLPMNAADALASGTHNHVPLVIGTNAEETSRMVAAVETPEQYAAAVRAQYGLTLGNQLLAIYPAADYPSPRYALVRLTTDVIWTCPARSLALAAATHQSEPVYRYYFTWHGPGIGGAIVGATHGIELPFVFREFEAFGYSPTPDDLVLSEATQRYWTRLAGGGDVNGPGDITWPRYDTSDPYLTFGEDITAAAGLRSEQCDAVDALAASL